VDNADILFPHFYLLPYFERKIKGDLGNHHAVYVLESPLPANF
jgi:hypothetical protein